MTSQESHSDLGLRAAGLTHGSVSSGNEGGISVPATKGLKDNILDTLPSPFRIGNRQRSLFLTRGPTCTVSVTSLRGIKPP